jgi:hypothetical protein
MSNFPVKNITEMKKFNYKRILLFLVLTTCLVPMGNTSAKQTIDQEVAFDQPKSLNIFPIDQDILDSLDEDQKKWFRRFNEGVLFFDGWQDISHTIIKQYPREKQNEVRRFIQRIGIIIGTEWSKDNTIRKINTNQLDSWGDRLKEAANKDNVYLTLVLSQIGDEIKTLLRD